VHDANGVRLVRVEALGEESLNSTPLQVANSNATDGGKQVEA
jgi:hypothetical protein